MKKLFLMAVVAVFGFANVNAQDFNLGVNAGLPVGDAGDISSFSLILDANYIWEVSDQFDAGIATGYSHSFGKSKNLDGANLSHVDFGYIPVAGAGRFNVSEKFILGLDLGYAIGVSNGNDGGFYYVPKVQYGLSDKMDMIIAYRGVSLNGGSFDILSAGLEFKL